ncbi:UNVERIFIED_CONTAM: hypothetical protein HDU68_008472 [Siphonaria sp. JEL0065]|nr:hypothetical protein HDU68_008472 [Siphonaria sp. JEL0065]
MGSLATIPASKAQSSITVGFIGPYEWLPGLTYNGSLVVGGYDQINITIMSDLDQWGLKSWWYWNQQAMHFAIEMINQDPTILPNTTIKIKRFNNHQYYKKRKNGSPGKAIAVAQEIVEEHEDVIAVFGDFFPNTMSADAEIYGYYKIPQCTGTVILTSLWDRFKYGYYFQTYALTGYAESIALLLRKWNVNRIAMIDTHSFSDPYSNCGYVSRVLEKQGFEILARINTGETLDIDYIIKALGRVDARYIMMCGSVEGNSKMYFELAHRKQFVGPEYVWFTDNMPFGSTPEDIERWGPDYYKHARGIYQTFGSNVGTQEMDDHELKLLKAINDFQAPWGPIFPVFARTDVQLSKIDYVDGLRPLFYDGGSIPPPDGPTYTTLLISSDTPQASLLTAFMITGLVISIGFSIIIFINQKKTAIRSGSVTFLSIMTLGSIPAYVANSMYIGVPSSFKCESTLWLQLASFVLMTSAMVFKNLRIILIYTTKVKLPKYLVQDWFWVVVLASLLVVEMVNWNECSF